MKNEFIWILDSLIVTKKKATTNSDTLYSYRIIVPSNLVGQVSAGPARHLILADTKEEQEYVRIMRMLRSYELQQIDRD